MKKYLIIFGLIGQLISPKSSSACDLCGCGNGGSFLGILPQAHRGFVGLRYGYKSYDSHINSVSSQTHEDFWKTELWARAFPFKKVQVLAFMPYNFNKQTIQKTGQQTDLQGLGDISILANYNMLNTMTDTIQHQFFHNLMIGGGVKLPTGRYKYDLYNDTEVGNPNFQLGTGSLDFMLNLVYTLRHKSWGLNTDLSYKINTENSDKYRFGNRIITNISALYFIRLGDQKTLMPNVGISYENGNLDTKSGVKNIRTGGEALLGSYGLESYFKKFSMGVNYQVPIAQNLSNGELRANNRLNVHFTVML